MSSQDPFRTAAALRVVVGIVDEDEIKIGVIIELTPSHLSHTEDGESPFGNGAESLLYLIDGDLQGAFQTSLGKIGELDQNRLELNGVPEVVKPYANELLSLVAPQRIELGFQIVLILQRSAQFPEHFIL